MTADTVGGVWTYALELSRALGERGITVALATMGAKLTREQWEQTREVPALSVFESSFRLEWMDNAWDDVARAGEWLLALEQQIRPDVVHLNGYSHAALPWNAPCVVVAHSCVLSWWMAVKGGSPPAMWRQYKDAVTRGLFSADLVIAPSQSMLSTLEHSYGSLTSGRVIYNGRSAAHFTCGPKQPFVLCAGRLWDEAKNVRALEAVAPGLQWPVYVAGEHNKADASVRVLGRLSAQALAGWFARASIYALPARYEPFGLSAVEAGLSGCALVLGNIPSLREIWGGAAVFVSPDEPEALRAAINELIRDTPRRARLGANAHQRALEFTPQRMVEAYLDAYYVITSRSDTNAGNVYAA
jgi:glycogen(starch) synthase